MKRSLLVLIFLSLLCFGCFHPVRMQGTSMLPSIKDGDRLIVNTNYGELKRGDIVVHLYPKDQTKIYVKRIIALPNETIEISAGKVFIDGKRLDEDYIDQNYNLAQGDLAFKKVEADSYFVMGDNRDNSSDSRYWGTLKKELIQGTVSINYGDGNRK